MVLDFDMDRAPSSGEDFLSLVRSILAAQDVDEGLWIEWKSSLDLRTVEGKKHVVRAILAFANRMPDAAMRFCQGRAFLVIGAQPGQLEDLVGVSREDPADLDNWWRPYLGTDGPHWTPHWVQLEGGKSVLVIEVAAPRAGDPIRTLRKELPGMREGRSSFGAPGVHSPLRLRKSKVCANEQRHGRLILLVSRSPSNNKPRYVLSRYMSRTSMNGSQPFGRHVLPRWRL